MSTPRSSSLRRRKAVYRVYLILFSSTDVLLFLVSSMDVVVLNVEFG